MAEENHDHREYVPGEEPTLEIEARAVNAVGAAAKLDEAKGGRS